MEGSSVIVSKLEKRLQFSGLLIAAGLVVEAVTLRWTHPLAFLVFMGVGGLLLTAGIVSFLLALVSFAQGSSELRSR